VRLKCFDCVAESQAHGCYTAYRKYQFRDAKMSLKENREKQKKRWHSGK